MGCQKDIVQQIVEGKGDCVSPSNNQPKLSRRRIVLRQTDPRDFEDLRYRHPRDARRERSRIDPDALLSRQDAADFAPRPDWLIKALGYALRSPIPRRPKTCECVTYVNRIATGGKRFAEGGAATGHQSIHRWVLNVTFRRTNSRSREHSGRQSQLATPASPSRSNVTPSKTTFVAKCSAAATTRAFSPKSLRSTRFDIRLAVSSPRI